jgi:hypothetical protein
MRYRRHGVGVATGTGLWSVVSGLWSVLLAELDSQGVEFTGSILVAGTQWHGQLR